MADDELERDLGLLSALTIGVGTMVGAGIFVLPGAVTATAGPVAIAAFVLGGVIAVFTGLSASELSTAMPEAGGTYVYINYALGPLAGTIAGLGSWIGMSFASAFYSIGFGEYVAVFFDVPDVGVGPLVVTGAQLSALLLGVGLIGVNYAGAKVTGQLQNGIVIVLLVILAGFAIVGISNGDASMLQPFAPGETGGYAAIFPATALIFVSYIGFAKIATVAEEMKNPGRNLPLSIVGSIVVTVTVYVLVMVTLLVLIPWDEVAGNDTAVADAGGLLFGSIGVTVMTVAGLLATASSTNAAVLAASRINFAMGRDEIVSTWTGETHEEYGSPYHAVVLTGGIILAFILIGDIETLAKAGSVLHLILYGLLNVSLMVLHQAEVPGYDPEFTVPFYPVVPIVGTILSFGLIAFMVPIEIAMSVAFVVVAVGWYFLYTQKRVEEPGVLGEYLGGRDEDLEESMPSMVETLNSDPEEGAEGEDGAAEDGEEETGEGEVEEGSRDEEAAGEPPAAALEERERDGLSRATSEEGEFRILVPLSDPESERDVITLACAIADHHDGTIVVEHFLQVHSTVAMHRSLEAGTPDEAAADDALEGVLESTTTFDVPVETRVNVTHRTFEELVSTAKRTGTDLVVLSGTENATWIPCQVGHPVLERARGLPCDFLVLDGDEFDPQRLLVPTDGGPDSALGSEIAVTLAARSDVDVTLLHVVDGDDERETGEEFLADWAETYGLTDAERIVDTSDGVRASIERHAGDETLVIVGATARSLLGRVARRNLRYNVAADLDVPVLLAERDTEGSRVERVVGRLFGE